MNLDQIKQAVNAGYVVYWTSKHNRVVATSTITHAIKHSNSPSLLMPLTNENGDLLGRPYEYFISNGEIPVQQFARAFRRWDANKDSDLPGFKQQAQDCRKAIEGWLKQLPTCSGFKGEIKFDWVGSLPDRLLFDFEFGNASDFRFYFLTITPSLADGYTLEVQGEDDGRISNLLYDIFDAAFEYA